MPVLSGTVESEGALVDTLFEWSATAIRQMRVHLRPIPQAVPARALLDTGAEVTCLDPSLVRALGLPSRGYTPANVPATGGLTFGLQHDAAVTILHSSGNDSDHLVLSDLLILEVSLTALGYQALVGRDVLARCRFLYDRPSGRFRLRY